MTAIVESLHNELTAKETEHLIGGLNGRQPFVKYITKKSTELIERGADRQQVLAMIAREHGFWSSLLKDQMAKYDLMRTGTSGLERDEPFVHYDFDDLFRYCPDPVQQFGIDLDLPLDQRRIEALTADFKQFIEKHRKPLPKTPYPFSLVRFYSSVYVSLLRIIINLPFIISSHKPPVNDFWLRVFASANKEKDKRAQRFWVVTISAALLFNIVILSVTFIGFYSESQGAHLVISTIVAVIIELFFAPILIVSIVQLGRTVIAFSHGRKSGVATVKTWRKVRRSFDDLWRTLANNKRREYFRMVEELYSDFLINKTEYMRLISLELNGPAPSNPLAQDRIKRWMNLCHMGAERENRAESASIPAISSWEEVASVTLLIFSLNEKFYYAWDELTASESGGKTLIEPLLETLRRAYPEEWENMVERIRALCSQLESGLLLDGKRPLHGFKNHQAITHIEQWANLRLQTLYNTMEGARKVFIAYRCLAEEYFPISDSLQIERLVRDKVQVILLHDCYPFYSVSNHQRISIERYLIEHPELELKWPEDLLHASKSGAWANVLASIRGEFLMTLDADHSINIEEICQLPNLLEEFRLDPKLDVVQYRLCSFNDKYSLITKCAAVSEDSWWIQGLRVKALVGGGGAYGKLVYRATSIRERELVQPDSVCEDMLTMARLQADGAKIKFVEYMQIGQGNDVTYSGLKRKYGRYPVGGIESSLSKLFKEMLLSTKTSWHSKVEALFMVSYYPVQALIVFASFVALLGSVYRISLDYIPAIILAIGYLLILSQGLQLLVNLCERHGYVKGLRSFIAIYMAVNVLYVSYIPHYLEQLIKGLKGYARFNISEKLSEQVQDNWDNTYRRNKIPVNIGSVLCGVSLISIIINRWPLLTFLAYLPFMYNGIIWAIGPFIFIPRKRRLLKLFDFVAPLPYVMVRSYVDIGTAIALRLKRRFRDEKQ